MKNICDWNNCNEIGEYRAPIEKDNSRKYRMLCLEHVKEFNKNWNYFSAVCRLMLLVLVFPRVFYFQNSYQGEIFSQAI